MSDLLSTTLDHLRELVACDTQNPPRQIADSGIIRYLRARLATFDLEFEDHGEGCQSLLAVRGEPRVLFNFHIDTVPASEKWETDPFDLVVDDERAVGLGACDIKGAAACMLAAVEETDGDVALLFTSDEEAGSSRCVRQFLKRRRDYDAVIVAEPTQAEAVLEHRGIATYTGTFHGIAGHASDRRALEDSAVHRAVRWAEAALEYAERNERTSYKSLSGIRFNLGVFEGGIKPNIIAPSATVRFGFRPLPDQDAEAVMADFEALAPTDAHVEWAPGFYGPTLPAEGGKGKGEVAADARRLADDLGLPVGDPVDFWTEASLFSEAGFTSLVYGPGDIAQAHTAGEWVALEQLKRVAETYRRLLS
ncbi:acetylornithine deacetylase [Persicimonas caeni]|jgi:acetylornithine deacetylase|uniref:N-acetyl-L-citrulline deacetylase n=1 Tax=Persicimonas caeni TaxID=2292766 RepID=A0A4Y6PXI4_PERCE|nr:acetylornithine deacetylase [Persicimonas caeni]QDG52839.1 acetylornithine deacetylase [Persicimonas caeni]QED34061.1 acetylornithine deacetylase [Persicimonas caeni]